MISSLLQPKRVIALGTAVAAASFGVFLGCRGDFGGLGGGSDFLDTGKAGGAFQVFQIDPRSEDSAGPQFVVSADLNGDGLMDLVSAWNQSQPVQLHIQSRSETGVIRFETLALAGEIPAVATAGLAVADFDRDGRPDVAVLIKESLIEGAACLDSQNPGNGLRGVIVLYLAPADPAQINQSLAWQEVAVGASFLQGTGSATAVPEIGGFTSMAVGDMDNDADMDLVVAWNSSCSGGTLDAVVFTNNGPGAVRDGSWTGTRIPDPFPKGSTIKHVSLADIDRDGDLDIIATFPTALSKNIRWYRNPRIDIPDDFHISDGGWQVGLIAQISTGADVVTIGDIDRDGIVDVVARSTNGQVIQWLKGPDGPTTSPVRSVPWQVFTIAEFRNRVPDALTLGDLDFDGRVELFTSAGGALAWFDVKASGSVFDQWTENLIVDDETSNGAGNTVTTDPNVSLEEVRGGTLINTILVVDLDGDGANDLVTTLDRDGLSGLSNDALAWFRNTRRPPR